MVDYTSIDSTLPTHWKWVNHHSWLAMLALPSCKSTSASNELKAGLDELIQVFHRQGPAWTMEWWTNPGTRWIATLPMILWRTVHHEIPWVRASFRCWLLAHAGPTSPSLKFSKLLQKHSNQTLTLGRRRSILSGELAGTHFTGSVGQIVPGLNDLADAISQWDYDLGLPGGSFWNRKDSMDLNGMEGRPFTSFAPQCWCCKQNGNGQWMPYDAI